MSNTKRHILIDDDDWAFLSQMYDRHYGLKRIVVSKIVRALIKKHVRRLKAKEEEMLNERDTENL